MKPEVSTKGLIWQRAKPVIFAILCIMTYSGSVNLGWSGVIPAIPFLIALVLMGASIGGKYLRVMSLVIVLCGGLLSVKHIQTPVFQPGLGEVVVSTESMCYKDYLKEYKASMSGPLSISLDNGSNCSGQASQNPDKGRWPAGKKFTVKGIKVSSPDFVETYSLILDSEHGDVSYTPKNQEGLIVKVGGQAIQESDLRRAIFYYPSLLMYYVIFPIMILSMLG